MLCAQYVDSETLHAHSQTDRHTYSMTGVELSYGRAWTAGRGLIKIKNYQNIFQLSSKIKVSAQISRWVFRMDWSRSMHLGNWQMSDIYCVGGWFSKMKCTLRIREIIIAWEADKVLVENIRRWLLNIHQSFQNHRCRKHFWAKMLGTEKAFLRSLLLYFVLRIAMSIPTDRSNSAQV